MALITGLSRQRELVYQQRVTERIARGLDGLLRREIVRAMREIGETYENPGKKAEAIQRHRDNVESILERGWRASFALFGKRLIEAASKGHKPAERKDIFDSFESLAGGWIRRNAAQKVTQIAGTTADQAQAVIRAATATAVADGLGQAATGKLIRDAMGVQASSLSVARSRVIARTETHAASQAANQVAAEVSELPMKKEWISASDARTRDDHASADGQTVGKLESFSVGGEELMYPGDPSGSAENVINCRCAVGYLVED